MSGRSILPGLLCIAILAVSSAGWAEDNAISASTLFDEGNELYREGKFVEAEKKLQQSWELKQVFDTAANLGDCEIRIGQHRDAAQHLSFAVRNLPNSTGAKVVERLRARLAEAKEKVVEIAVKVTAAKPVDGAVVKVDGRLIGKAPLPASIFVEPGSHKVSVELAGHATTMKTLNGAAGTKTEVTLTLLALSSHPDARIWAGGLVVFAIGLTVGAVNVGLANGKAGEADDVIAQLTTERGQAPCANSTDPRCTESDDLRGQGDLHANVGLWGFIGGGVVGVATGLYVLIGTRSHGKPAPREKRTTMMVPLVTPTAQGMAVRIHW